ncbi:MAG: hypothetical protein GY926_22400 [bacterium]|nr:hypothetical protein [bacterium]
MDSSQSAVVAEVPASRALKWGRTAFVAAAAVLIIVGAVAVTFQPSGDTELQAAASLPVEELYYWPSDLPPGWEILETERQTIEHAPTGSGVLAAIAPGDRIIMISATPDDGTKSDEQPISVKVINGVEFGVIWADDLNTVLTWQVDGYRFYLSARSAGMDEAFRLAAGTTAEHDEVTGDITELRAPLANEYEVVADLQPENNTDKVIHVFRLGCPEVDPGQDCALQLTIAPLLPDSSELTLAYWRIGRETSQHSTACGEVILSDEQDPFNTNAIALIDRMEFSIGPDFGPLEPIGFSRGVGVGHSPLTISDVETILCGLDQIDAATYNQLDDRAD